MTAATNIMSSEVNVYGHMTCNGKSTYVDLSTHEGSCCIRDSKSMERMALGGFHRCTLDGHNTTLSCSCSIHAGPHFMNAEG